MLACMLALLAPTAPTTSGMSGEHALGTNESLDHTPLNIVFVPLGEFAGFDLDPPPVEARGIGVVRS